MQNMPIFRSLVDGRQYWGEKLLQVPISIIDNQTQEISSDTNHPWNKSRWRWIDRSLLIPQKNLRSQNVTKNTPILSLSPPSFIKAYPFRYFSLAFATFLCRIYANQTIDYKEAFAWKFCMYCWLLHIVCMYQENEKSRALCENTTWVVMRLLSGGQPPSVNSKNANLLVSDILKCHFQIFRSDPPSLSLSCVSTIQDWEESWFHRVYKVYKAFVWFRPFN